MPAFSIALRGRKDGAEIEWDETGPAYAIRTGSGGSSKPMICSTGGDLIGVRRLTPLECERLQGFPDGYTDGQSDAQRYRQLGNSVAIPCVQWIVDRLVAVDQA
ncbi:DNA methylase [Mycobacterium phage Beem]|nr:DNA methylase [Mycobacterium phage Beem]